MKLSELKPCANCGGIIAPMWQVMRVSMAMLSREANTVLGMTQMLGGNLGLAEAMSPSTDVVVIAGDKEPELMKTLHVCQNCYLMKRINLAELCEKAGAE